MGVAEVERIEGVGRGVMGLLWLWKCVEKSKAPAMKAIRGAHGHPPCAHCFAIFNFVAAHESSPA
jgi:hypothetical protein